MAVYLATRQFEKQDADKTAADYTNHDAPDPNLGSEKVKAAVIMFKQAFPDAQNKIAFQLAEADKVASRYPGAAHIKASIMAYVPRANG